MIQAKKVGSGAPEPLGVTVVEGGVNVAVFARHATQIIFYLFDQKGEKELARLPLPGRLGDVHHGFVSGVGCGARYGLRADGPFEPAQGHRYDPAKLLVDPYAKRLDRSFRYVPELSAPRAAAIDTAPFVPRAVVIDEIAASPARIAGREPPGLIYEIAVKAFTYRHPQVPANFRGTISALAEPPVIEHLHKLGVTHVELMPIAAWMDERHLPPLGLANAWGYNPIVFMALDPRLAPNGETELAQTVARLHEADIAVILDVVFNHTAESDEAGPTVSLRGLDNAAYYRHFPDDPGRLVNDTGCGNTLACERAPVLRLVTDSMRHFVKTAGIDGFRFDLATVLGRSWSGFSPEAPLLSAIAQDPILRGTLLIAEPWDVGPGGYRLGEFPAPFLEWNDKYRDDVRRFWRGDAGVAGGLATRFSGSSDIFQSRFRPPSASVNYLASHDGFALADLVSFAQKHNDANGEGNRDGLTENHSWNNGAEGKSDDAAILEGRKRDMRALLATLFLSRGTLMLTAGDELGRTQSGNNNAYCQDNYITFIDWDVADAGLVDFVARLSALRHRFALLRHDDFLTGTSLKNGTPPDVEWLHPTGRKMRDEDWASADVFGMLLSSQVEDGATQRLCVIVNRSVAPVQFRLAHDTADDWTCVLESAGECAETRRTSDARSLSIGPRSVAAFACP
ncbi:MAG: glycogen debranching protein GlgX [Hyphomicrobiales bacterium]|nr:glycogen debranching protein GlgX [Hyphomicrobiales bacterium]